MLRIGATAFGGGSATIVAMRQLSLRKRWLSEEEFLETVVLSRVTPGITILAQVILIGKAIDGIRGAVAGLIGMLGYAGLAMPMAISTRRSSATAMRGGPSAPHKSPPCRPRRALPWRCT